MSLETRLLLSLFLLGLLSMGSLAVTQDEYVEALLAVPTAQACGASLKLLTAEPHLAGTIEDYNTAVWVRDQWVAAGIPEVEIVEYQSMLNYPLSRVVTMTSPTVYNMTLKEAAVSVDPTSNNTRSVPTFNGYAPTGIADGHVVYVNYGRKVDYDYLKAAYGNDYFKDKIVLARYGQVFRGLKVMLAEENGAVGVLIYSDPFDDGYFSGLEYPEGSFRPPSGVQRGSCQFLSICPGDPDTERTSKMCIGPDSPYKTTYPSIPVQPISWEDAEPLLRNLQGDPVPRDWQGGLPFHYRFGNSATQPVVVHMNLLMNLTKTASWNVIGKIPGEVEPDRQVILGNHRDAWVFGAVDPSSGTAALVEVVKGFGHLLSMGWKPRRTLVFASWDGEEYGLIGSTNWAETLAESLSEEAVAYLNVDIAVDSANPKFALDVSPHLLQPWIDASEVVKDPKTGEPLAKSWDQKGGVLGSGSDYTVFLDHLGIASSSSVFDGPAYGVYHSIYDSYYWMENFGDPGFQYHVAMAQMWSVVAYHLSSDVLLPFNVEAYATALSEYVVSANKESTDAGLSVDFAPLWEAVSEFKNACETLHHAIAEEKEEAEADEEELRELNDKMCMIERHLLSEGLPARPWFKSVIQAPGVYAGYGSDVFPGIVWHIRRGEQEQAQAEVNAVALLIQGAAEAIEVEEDDEHHNMGLAIGLPIGLAVLCAIILIIVIAYRRKNNFDSV